MAAKGLMGSSSVGEAVSRECWGGNRQGDGVSSDWGRSDSAVPGDGQVKMWNRQLDL